jgi:hypothetical protein
MPQFPLDASLALQRRWSLLEPEPPPAAQQRPLALAYKVLRDCCLRGTHQDVLARLHHMAGTGCRK